MSTEKKKHFIDIGIVKDFSSYQNCAVDRRITDQFDDKYLQITSLPDVSPFAILGGILLFEIAFIIVTYINNRKCLSIKNDPDLLDFLLQDTT
jgi:hypothetical protein